MLQVVSHVHEAPYFWLLLRQGWYISFTSPPSLGLLQGMVLRAAECFAINTPLTIPPSLVLLLQTSILIAETILKQAIV